MPVTTEDETTAPQDDAAEPTSEGDRRVLRRRRQWLAAALLGPLVVLGVFTAGSRLGRAWVWDSPRAFEEVFVSTVGGFTSGFEPGTPHHFALTEAPLPEVRILAIEPVVAEGSGPAATGVGICRLAGAWTLGATGLEGLHTTCDDLVPAAGAELGALEGRHMLLLSVVPLTTDGVRVVGVDLTYSTGGRTWTDRYETDLSVGG